MQVVLLLSSVLAVFFCPVNSGLVQDLSCNYVRVCDHSYRLSCSRCEVICCSQHHCQCFLSCSQAEAAEGLQVTAAQAAAKNSFAGDRDTNSLKQTKKTHQELRHHIHLIFLWTVNY